MMSKSYVTIGIDLGTTNSAICVSADDGYEIVKNSFQFDYTPSVFGIDKSGKYLVGKRAYDKLANSSSLEESQNYKAETKRLMGTATRISFPRCDKEFMPEEIAAEILKSLRADALRKCPDLFAKAAVITVPAYFETLQCEATKRAGNLAGFEHVALLQEPIAAALTYGFSNDEDANWLVYDLGGGTFDIALIQSKDKAFSVRQHNGDNFLGGKDFDARIVERVFIPRLKAEFSLPYLEPDNPRYSFLLTKLKYIAEESKIFLSKESSITVELDDLGEDDQGREIYTSFEMTIDELEEAVADLVEKTVRLVNDTIDASGIEKTKISTIVLVGGPTQLPFIRRRLEESTGIHVDSSVDPLTVVAKGAAIYGKSQKLPLSLLEANRVASANEISLNLQYDSITSDDETLVVGKFDVPEDGYSVQIQSTDSQYIGDRIPLRQGKFFETLPLRKGATTAFQIFLLDKDQNPVPTFPDHFEITQGISISSAPIPRNIGVVYSKMQLSGGLGYKEQCQVYFKAGSTLPLKHTETFKTLREVRLGTANELPIKVYEGDSANIDFNRILTTLSIDGNALPYSLPEGSDIEITISINESREFEVEAYIPDMDISIDARVATYEEEITDEQINEKINSLRSAYSENRDYLQWERREEIEQRIESIESSFSSRAADEDKRNLIIRESNDVLKELERVDEESAVERYVADARDQIQAIREVLPNLSLENSRSLSAQLSTIESEVDGYRRSGNRLGLERSLEKLQQLFFAIATQTVDFWALNFDMLSSQASEASDYYRFQDLRQQGVRARNAGDVNALRSVCSEMWGLLPHQVGESFDSTLSGVTK